MILGTIGCSGFFVSSVHATPSSISLSISGSPVVILHSSNEGKFADSGNSTVTITTNHAAGYTLTAKASSSTSLEGIKGGSIPSISTAVSPANYADNTYATTNSLNDTWGYKPSVLYNSSTGATDANTNYLPSPGLGTAQSPADTLAVTNNANDGSYTVSIGTRVTTATDVDSYSNAFVFTVIGNPTPYAITYDQNTTDTVTNMPTNHTTSDPGATGETVTIDSTVPVRDGYIFKGWCSVSTSDDTCSGTTYNPDGGGTALSLTINQQSTTNTYSLYAMWEWFHHPIITNSGYISYNPNAAGVNDSMGDQELKKLDSRTWSDDCEDAGGYGAYYDELGRPVCVDFDTEEPIDVPYPYVDATEFELWASNFQRPGYGFVGWSDKFDWVVNENDSNGDGTGPNIGYHIYGPNETISFTAGQYSDPNPGLSLYAVWVPSEGNLQGWTGCSSLPQGNVTALTDTRDNQVYAVAKLKDNKCWMIENFRLENEHTTSATDIAKAQGYNSSFIGLAAPETNFYGTTANSLYSIDGSTLAPAITGDYQGERFPRYNNQNTASSIGNMVAWEHNVANIYSLGNYYTWAAAAADTSYYTGGTYDTTSICPAGWHIPSGDATGEYYDLNVAQNSGSSGSPASSIGLRKYPANLLYSGAFGRTSPGSRGSDGYYISSSISSAGGVYTMRFTVDAVYTSVSYSRDQGYSVRCLKSP